VEGSAALVMPQPEGSAPFLVKIPKEFDNYEVHLIVPVRFGKGEPGWDRYPAVYKKPPGVLG